MESSENLPGEAWVVKGGRGDVSTMIAAALGHHAEFGDYALSACSASGLSVREIATEGAAVGFLPHTTIRTTTVGALEGAGYAVIPTPDEYPHVDIMLPDPPADADWDALAGIFGPPEPNPGLETTEESE